MLRSQLFRLALPPMATLFLLSAALSFLGQRGLGMADTEPEARHRTEANQEVIVNALDSGERVQKVYVGRPRGYHTLPQLLVAMLPVPVAFATMHETTTLAINAVLGYDFPPTEWLSREVVQLMRPSTPVYVSASTLAVAVSFVLVRIVWPGGRMNLAVSGSWCLFPMAVDFLFLGGTGIPSPGRLQLWLSPFLWPGLYSLQWLFLALFAFDAWMYFKQQRHYLFVLSDRQVCVFRGSYLDYRWRLLEKIMHAPELVRRVDRPLGTDVTLRTPTQTLAFSLHNRQEADAFCQALELPHETQSGRRSSGLPAELLRAIWLVPVYLWLSAAFVNVVHDDEMGKLLIACVILPRMGDYELRHDVAAMRHATDYVLSVKPNDRVALLYRARVLEDEGNAAEAEAIYQRLGRQASGGGKIVNTANERLMKMHARHRVTGAK